MESPVTFESGGSQLIGMLHAPENPKGSIIMCHGFGSSKIGTNHGLFVKAARRFASLGFKTLRFDFRGSGDSEGEFEYQSATSKIEDLKASMDFLGGDSFGVMGHSAGGVIALLTAARDKRIRCLSTWAAPSILGSVTMDAKVKGEFIYWHNFKISAGILEDYKKYNLEDDLKKIAVPCLVVHGNQDQIVPEEHAKRIFNLLKSYQKKLLIIDNSNHFFSEEESTKKIIEKTGGFLKLWLK